MNEIYVVYWSGTGNTEAMASMIAKGIEKEGAGAKVVSVSDIIPQDLEKETVFALGCPSMGAEQLEETEMEPFVSELEGAVKDKKIALFGSYGWGECEWMREWEERMKKAGAMIINDEGVTVLGEPDKETEEACHMLGKELVKSQSL